MRKKLLLAAVLTAAITTAWADSWTWSYATTPSFTIDPKPSGISLEKLDDGTGFYTSALTFIGTDANDEASEAYWTMTILTPSQTKKPTLGGSGGAYGFYIGGNSTNNNYPQKVTLACKSMTTMKVASITLTASHNANFTATAAATVNGVSYGEQTFDDVTAQTAQEFTFMAPANGAEQGEIDLVLTNTGVTNTDGYVYFGIVGITINFVEESSDSNTYGIVGDLTGGWDNDLQLVLSGGKYKGSIAGFAAATQNAYAYKLRANQSWDGYQLPDGSDNYYWYTRENDGIGIYDIDFSFDRDADELTLNAKKTADLKVAVVGAKRKGYDEEENDNAIFSGYWDAATTTDYMTLGEDGRYTLRFENVTFTTSMSIEMKAIAKRDAADAEPLAWYPADNVYCVVPRAGSYDITITFDPKAEDLWADDALTATIEEHQEQFNVTYVNVNDWATVYAYTFGPEASGAWHGTQLTDIVGQKNGHDIYAYSFLAKQAPQGIIFNDGADARTDDLVFENGKQYWDDAADQNFTQYDYPDGASWMDDCQLSSLNGVYTSDLGGITWTVGDLSWPAQTMIDEETGQPVAGGQDPTNLRIAPTTEYCQFGAASEKFSLTTFSLTSQPLTRQIKSVSIKAWPYRAADFTFTAAVGDTELGSVSMTANVNDTYTLKTEEPVAGAVKLSFSQTTTCAFYLYEIHIAFDDGTTTAISNITPAQGDSSCYDLQGRRVAQPQKGLYIVNGKKVIVK